ncbi:MAG: DUF6339 family protein [Proteobacteria bacterium]|nr:DUF6339 family protein [Pseudomonadota bacterium]
MPVKMFRSIKSVDELTATIKKNLPLYKGEGDDFAKFLADQSYATLDIEFDESVFDKLICKPDAVHDFDNALLLWEALKITPRIARETRLWVYLTHSIGLTYTRARWSLGSNDGDNINYIKAHYLADNSPRSLDRNNALSRLWMSAYVADKVKSMNLKEALRVLLHNTDFRENIIGRPTVNRSPRVLDAVMLCAKDIIDKKDEDFFARKGGDGPYRRWLIDLNLVGGQLLLDAMGKAELQKLVNDLADKARQ